MDANKEQTSFPISVGKFGLTLRGSYDEVWMGILKRKCWDRKYTMVEWKQLLEDLKAGKVL